MSSRWRALPFLLFGLLVPSLTCASQPFENTAIVRTVELGGSLVHVTTTYAVKALEDGSSIYTVALGPEERKRTSWIEAKIKGQSKALGLEDLGYDQKRWVYTLIPHIFSAPLILFLANLSCSALGCRNLWILKGQ